MHVPKLCDWFGSSASASDSDNLVFTRSLLYASDCDSDSNSVTSENLPSIITITTIIIQKKVNTQVSMIHYYMQYL